MRGSLGRALQKGDVIQSFSPDQAGTDAGRSLPADLTPDLDMSRPFRVLPGPQMDYFSAKGIEVFTGSTYAISPVSDRQGIRTEGPQVERVKGPDIITDPTPLGSIQVPGSGLPIILHRDAQVTGGYAKIALLCQADMDRAGQLCPGDRISFQFISRRDAKQVLAQKEQLLAQARQALQP